MSCALQIRVVDRQQIVYSQEFNGPVELGRQIDAQEALYSARSVNADYWRSVITTLPEEQKKATEEHIRKVGLWRAIIAQLNEDTISRHHALLVLGDDGQVRLSNVSSKVPIRLSSGQDLVAGKSCELSLPTHILLGRKTVRVAVSDAKLGSSRLAGSGSLAEAGQSSLRRLAPSLTPAQLSIAGKRFPTLGADNVEIENMIRWLQSTMGVLQAACSSSDFFQKAAQAVVDIVGCDRGSVLLWEHGDWKLEALFHSPQGKPDPRWQPSQNVLTHVREEKATFWQSPDHALQQPESLISVEIFVAAPILDGEGQVIGAIYGDCQLDNVINARTRITKLEAMLVELLAGGVATGLARIEQEKAALEADIRFGQFFTPELSRQLARNPDLLKGRDSDVTLMFADIRAFSRISERLGPAGTVDWIGDVMNELSDCVLKHRGVLVDYVGDELMAMWGAPEEQPHHARLACRAALDMLTTLPRLNQRWEETLGEPMRLGIGINTGKARVGNTGSKHKFKYGPLGHHVNLASRVQGATKYLRTPLIVTEFTQTQLGDEFDLRQLCQVRVVNIASAVGLFELAPPSIPGWPEQKQLYEQALGEFEQGRGHFRQAARTLANLITLHPDDGPALVLLSRAINAAINTEVTDVAVFDPVWELPGK